MPPMPKTGFQILPGAVENHLNPAMQVGPSMVGVLEESWDWVKVVAQRTDPAVTKIYYKDLPDWSLWFDRLRHMPAEDAVTVWWDQAKRSGDTLDDMIGWAAAEGHRLVIGAFGEMHADMLNNPAALSQFADFERERAIRTWSRGGMASLFKFSTGTVTPERIRHIAHALDVCRWNGNDEPIAVFCIDEYAAIWPTTWMGPNQTDILPPDATRDQKFDALLDTPHPDFGDLAAWRPAWLVGRAWGMDNRDGTYGITELWDVLMMLGEFGVDVIIHDDIPVRGSGEPFGGWWTCRSVWTSRLGFAREEDGLRAALELGDDFYTRLRLPNGHLQVPWRMWFGAGPGHGWDDFDLFRSDSSFRTYVDYCQTPAQLPPALAISSTITTSPTSPTPPAPPEPAEPSEPPEPSTPPEPPEPPVSSEPSPEPSQPPAGSEPDWRTFMAAVANDLEEVAQDIRDFLAAHD